MTGTRKKHPKDRASPATSPPGDEKEPDLTIGRLVRAHRVACGMTVQQLADLIDVDRGSVSKLENGKQNLTNERIQKLAAAFNVSLSQLFEYPAGHAQSPAATGNLERSIIAPSNRGGLEPRHCRPVKSFSNLKDIPHGENVLIDGVKNVLGAKAGEQKWEIDEAHQVIFPGDPLRKLQSSPTSLVAHIIADDAMTPRLQINDSVVIDTADLAIPSTGGAFAVVFDGQPIEVRRLFPKIGNGLTVSCDNQHYKPIELNVEERGYMQVIGRIKGLFGTGGF